MPWSDPTWKVPLALYKSKDRLFQTGQYSSAPASQIKSTWFVSKSDPSNFFVPKFKILGERVIPITIPEEIMLLMAPSTTEGFIIFWKVKQKMRQFSNRFNNQS